MDPLTLALVTGGAVLIARFVLAILAASRAWLASRRFPVRCAWCERPMRWGWDRRRGSVSHGMCPRCVRAFEDASSHPLITGKDR